MKYTDMLDAIDRHSQEILKVVLVNEKYTYERTDKFDKGVCIVYSYSCYGEYTEDEVDLTFDEYNSENGVQMYLDRRKRELEEYERQLDEKHKENEKIRKQLRYEQYMKLKKEFENIEVNNE